MATISSASAQVSTSGGAKPRMSPWGMARAIMPRSRQAAETRGIAKQYGEDKFTSVVPSVSLLSEFPAAIVDKVVDKRGTRDLAKSYLDFLYTPEGQKIAAEFGHRVNDPTVAAEFKDQFPEIRLVNVDDVFGGWKNITKEHFAEGAILDSLYGSR